MNLIFIGTLASLTAGSATIVGAAFIFLLKKISEKFLDAAMGFSGGVMLAATFFGLITPAIRIGGVWRASVGMITGTIFLIIMEKTLPHIHRLTGVRGPSVQLKKIWLLILAMTIHNFPEGLAVGVGFAQGDMRAGTVLAVGNGTHSG